MKQTKKEMQIEEGDQRDSPSFRMYFSERFSAAADHDENNKNKVEEDDEDDFEFSFIQIPESGTPIAADDIFSNGKILPVYPVFNRDLLLGADNDSSSDNITTIQQQKKKERRAPLGRLFEEEERGKASLSSSSSFSSSSSLDELDAIPPGTYCVWNPRQLNKDRCKKSNSMGSSPSSSRWKLKDLVVGRSKSEGKDKLVFIPTIEKAAEINGSRKAEKDDSKLGMKKPRPREVDVVTAQQRMMHYGQDMGRVTTGRKSNLPYKWNFVGLYNVNGLSPVWDPF